MPTDFLGDATIQAVLAKLEIDRKKIAKRQTTGYILVGVGIVIGCIFSFIFGIPVFGVIAGIISASVGGYFLYNTGSDLSAYRNSFKIDVIGHCLKSLDQSLCITPDKGIYENEFTESQLFTTSPDRYSTEDLVIGKVDKTAFYFAEIHAEYKTETSTKNGTKTEWHDIFKGIIFTADFNKNFKSFTVVRPRDFGNAFGAWFSKNLFSITSKDIINLENVDFEKAFVTYGMDQVEARYILTPAMMERILTLNKQSKLNISLSFINSKLYIAFPLDRNCFEAPIFSTLLNPNLINEDINTIKFMFDVIKELDLNTRIWGRN
ncbi:DUF3137 domain-containing protein [Pedobacter changchengzhani]|uniref:DUF3137 domain-containing protein n=1 Tax=Pedobacter changchengzhani TaxID=2529274 RepID=A0A4R5MP48_9SPHI|nr:DUF3137 domain-containing protein [Pedobacter changchengzhani]TDG37468.1 DUF3137 domain-containing protein [Pedobacter changchengzhani]